VASRPKAKRGKRPDQGPLCPLCDDGRHQPPQTAASTATPANKHQVLDRAHRLQAMAPVGEARSPARPPACVARRRIDAAPGRARAAAGRRAHPTSPLDVCRPSRRWAGTIATTTRRSPNPGNTIMIGFRSGCHRTGHRHVDSSSIEGGDLRQLVGDGAGCTRDADHLPPTMGGTGRFLQSAAWHVLALRDCFARRGSK